MLVDRLGRELGRPAAHITPGTYQALERYDWPGNIRELENVLQQAIIVSHDGVLDLSAFVGESMQVETAARTPPSGSRSLIDVERDHIQLVLETVGWRIEGVAGAAQVLGLRPSAADANAKAGFSVPRNRKRCKRNPTQSRHFVSDRTPLNEAGISVPQRVEP